MRILKLRTENVKRISVIEVTPRGNVIEVSGRNGQGKSSLLDSIEWLLAGTKTIQSQPIRQGCDKAVIKAKLGDDDKPKYVVTREFSQSKGPTLTIKPPEGGKPYPSPQALLDDLIGDLSFDPLEFMRMKPAEQVNVLRGMVKLEIDVDALQKQNEDDYATRTDVNREAKMLQAQIDGFPEFPDNLPKVPVDTRELAQRLANAGQHNANIDTRRRLRQENIDRYKEGIADLEGDARQLRSKAEDLRRQAGDMEREATAKDAEARELKATLDSIPELVSEQPIDASAIQRELEQAQVTNQTIQRKQQRDALIKQVQEKEARSAQLTEQMAERERRKVAAIAAAKMPVAGLGFGSGCITFDGLPLDQASGAQQLRISCAIAMAANPKLRVLRIKDASLLDEDSMKLLEELAEDQDFQVWCELIHGGPAAIVLEDGHVKQDLTSA
jgi:DNA repair exonuclease SbcCD ATPase subunit